MRHRATRRLLLGASLALFAMLGSRPAVARCGDRHVDMGEDCDHGGTCIGGTNAGTACTAESQCIGEGVCVSGARPQTACSVDADCLGGACRRCITFGGDGCAANCTFETEASFALTSATTTVGNSAAFPPLSIALSGALTLTIGKQVDDRIPVVFRDGSPQLHALPIAGLCPCARAPVLRTCGGTLFEADGVTRSANCTDGYGGDPTVCDGGKPCTFAFGAGNAAVGSIGCSGGDAADVSTVANSADQSVLQTYSNPGPAGSAVLFTSFAFTVAPCNGPESANGTDLTFCTSDDPLTARGIADPIVLVTGEASGQVINSNGSSGQILGPFSVSGAAASCSALPMGQANGAAFAGVYFDLAAPAVGDVVSTLVLGLGAPVTLPTATPTVSSPTNTPTTMPTPSGIPVSSQTPTATPCGGDCDGNGQVGNDDVQTMLSVALGNQALTCPAGDINNDGGISVVDLLGAINRARTGCSLGS